MDSEPLQRKDMHKTTVYYDQRLGQVVDYMTLDEQKAMLRQTEPNTPEVVYTWQTAIANKLRFKNDHIRFFMSEMLGTFLLVVFGVGCVAQAVLNYSNIRFNVVAMNIGWGCGVAIAFCVCGGASGGHINPAITLCFAIMGRVKWRFVPAYMGGQYVGAFLGSWAVFIVYYCQLNTFDNGIRQGPYTLNATAPTAGIWATYPKSDDVKTWQCFVDQVFATGLLVLAVMALIDKSNMEVPKGTMPLIIGFLVLALGTAFESNCGGAVNPARDFSARLFTALFGWGSGVFSYRNFNWFWVPIIGPHIGALLGAWTYNICIGLHLPGQN